MHVAEQPLPFAVPPSSQASPPLIRPSPQIGVHVDWGAPEQLQPVSMAHVALQPSFAAVPPSSQASAPALMPSPQVVMQVLGAPLQV